ncbi:hypothetical protein [Dactylosporangium sp. NPDC050588]|uniref:hypothetical protein n=1 Tax=Dactylosporangium sp. NPDC050588 TaxID=3157211 RepID=UPI003403BEC1
MTAPGEGAVEVLGSTPGTGGTDSKPAFLAQGKPLYRRFTVDEMLRAGRALNPRWDHAYAHRLGSQSGRSLVPDDAWRVGSAYCDAAGTAVDFDPSSCKSADGTIETCLSRQRIATVSASFHPDGQFWRLQLTESLISSSPRPPCSRSAAGRCSNACCSGAAPGRRCPGRSSTAETKRPIAGAGRQRRVAEYAE